jgi:hypothetical protein
MNKWVKTGLATGIILAAIPVAFIILIFIYIFYPIYLPGFEGQIIDKNTGSPIENAYIICFTARYPASQAINLGGGNSYPDSIQITRSDKNGHFRVEPYKNYSGGWVRYRRVFFAKEGYIYAKQYLQLYKKKHVLRRNFETYRPSEELSVNKNITIHLSNEEEETEIHWDGEKIINGYLGLLGGISHYQSHFKYERKSEYEKLRPVFLDFLNIFRKHSEDIKKTFPKPHLVHNWNHELEWFGGRMDREEH